MSIVLNVHPGYPGGQQKKLLPFGHGRDLVAVFSGLGRDKQGFYHFGTCSTSCASGPIHYAPCGSVGA